MVDSDQEVDPDVPWNHGSDGDSSESLEWPDLEFWRPRWVGMSPSAIAHQIEQEAFQRINSTSVAPYPPQQGASSTMHYSVSSGQPHREDQFHLWL